MRSIVTCTLLVVNFGLGSASTLRHAPALTPGAARFDSECELAGRYPQLVAHSRFREWRDDRPLSAWHESALTSGTRTVVAQDASGVGAFAALSKDDQIVFATAIHLPVGSRRPDVLAVAAEANLTPDQISAIRPEVTFNTAGVPSLEWTVEVRRGMTIEVLRQRPAGLVRVESLPVKSLADAAAAAPPGVDGMGDNELHHLPAFASEATAWTRNAATVQEKARRVFERVAATYSYDATITNIAEFAWADYLTRDRNRRRGVSDEWAIVQVSYLRSIGIPARIKFLVWEDRHGRRAGHAALEYSDAGTWRHMDAMWNAFNDPGRYRQSGATHVTVMDADFPVDSRYAGNAWGAADYNGDNQLHPYRDFIISPAYPGSPRPGYSR